MAKGIESRKVAALALLVALVGWFSPPQARAATNSYVSPGSGKWESPFNWSAGAPGPGQSVFITNEFSKVVTVDSVTATIYPNTMTVGNLLVSGPPGTTNVLQVLETGNVLFGISNNLTVASGGVLIASNSSWGAQSSMTISNGTLINYGDLIAPGFQDFLFTVTGPSALTTNSGSLAFVLGSSNRMLVANGARVDTGDIYLGYADLPESFDSVTITGTNSRLNVGIWSIGKAGSSNQVFISNGGTVHIAGIVTLSSDPASQGNTITLLPGGTLEVGDQVYVANSDGAQAGFQVAGGVTVLSSNLVAGSFSNSLGVVSVTAGGMLVASNSVIGIGNAGTPDTGSGTGSLTVSNGTVLAADLLVGSTAGGLGTLAMQSNAVVTLNSNLTVVSSSLTSTSTVSLAGGSFVATNGLVQVGSTGAALMTVSGGSHTVREITLGSTNGAGTGSLYLLSGHLKVLERLSANSVVVACGDLDGNGGTVIVGAVDNSSLAVACGTATNIGTLEVGYTETYTGTFVMGGPGGFVQVTNMLLVGNSDDCVNGAQGNITLTDGLLAVTNTSHNAMLDLRNGSFTVNGGTLIADTLNISHPCGQFSYVSGAIHYNQLIVPPNTPPLRLAIAFDPSASALTLSWPSAYVGYTPEEISDLSSSDWAPVQGTATDDGTTRSIIVSATAGPSFYRLSKP